MACRPATYRVGSDVVKTLADAVAKIHAAEKDKKEARAAARQPGRDDLLLLCSRW